MDTDSGERPSRKGLSMVQHQVSGNRHAMALSASKIPVHRPSQYTCPQCTGYMYCCNCTSADSTCATVGTSRPVTRTPAASCVHTGITTTGNATSAKQPATRCQQQTHLTRRPSLHTSCRLTSSLLHARVPAAAQAPRFRAQPCTLCLRTLPHARHTAWRTVSAASRAGLPRCRGPCLLDHDTCSTRHRPDSGVKHNARHMESWGCGPAGQYRHASWHAAACPSRVPPAARRAKKMHGPARSPQILLTVVLACVQTHLTHNCRLCMLCVPYLTSPQGCVHGPSTAALSRTYAPAAGGASGLTEHLGHVSTNLHAVFSAPWMSGWPEPLCTPRIRPA